MKKLAAIVLLGILCLMVGCSLNGTEKRQEVLTLSVAASLTDCMTAMEESFKRQYQTLSFKSTLVHQVPYNSKFSKGHLSMYFFQQERNKCKRLMKRDY